jgi:LytS/YehU family sensor histidine kinase
MDIHPNADVALMIIGTVIFCYAAWLGCRHLENNHLNRDGMSRGFMAITLAVLHLGMVLMMLGAKHWSLVAIMVANIGMPVVYVGNVRFVRTLNETPHSASFPWRKAGGDLAIFSSGGGIMALAMAF